jgi:hypothetical protein
MHLYLVYIAAFLQLANGARFGCFRGMLTLYETRLRMMGLARLASQASPAPPLILGNGCMACDRSFLIRRSEGTENCVRIDKGNLYFRLLVAIKFINQR